MGGKFVIRFEEMYAKLTGARHCLAVANGTSALITALDGLDVNAGDEVIVPPYTFVATVNAVLLRGALPVFADIDLETFQMDPKRVEPALTDRTTAIIPVHMAGTPADLDAITAIGRRRRVPVIEDACQAHLAEWRGKKVGTLGTAGCFSFQGSKNLNSGEGGAVLTNDDAVLERCYSFHNNGRSRVTGNAAFGYQHNGANLRLTEFQGALLISQMSRLEEQSKRRDENAAYLTSMLSQVPGIKPARWPEGATRSAWHLYMFRYDKAAFAGAPRSSFLKAMSAEGIPCSSGYQPLNKEPFIQNILGSRGFKRLFSEASLKGWREKNECPMNDRLCTEAVWFTQTMLLGTRADMEQIVEAVKKVQAQAHTLKA